ncbi:MAG: hypothetical protein VW683_05280 [Betaproteobacteria bacterium]
MVTTPSKMQRTLLERTPENWKRTWRQVMTMIPATCVHSKELIDAGYAQCEHQEVSPEWAEVFDAFANEELCNKFLGAGGEGSAKSHDAGLFAVARYMYDMMTLPRKPELYWVIGADYEDAYKEWTYIKDFLESIGKLKTKKDSKGNLVPDGITEVRSGRDMCSFMTNDGVEFRTLSAKDESKIAREEPDGIIGAEASRWSGEAFRRSLGRIARKPNAWLFASGSFETEKGGGGDGGFQQRFNSGQGPNKARWKSASIPSFANRHIYPAGENDYRIAEIKEDYSSDRYDERILGKPAAPKGQVITTVKPDVHIDANLTYDPREPVYLFMDPGTLVYCVLFVQIIRNQVRVIDEIYQAQADREIVINEARTREGWRYITQKGHVADHAGFQRHGGGKAPLTTWQEITGIKFNTLGRGMENEDKAELILSFLHMNRITGAPYLVISPDCRGLLAECGIGISPTSDQGGGRWMREVGQDGVVRGIKRENDHACSALAYGLSYHRGQIRPNRTRQTSKPPRTYAAARSTGSVDDFVQSPLDYEAFPGKTITRNDGVEIRLPGKKMSDLERTRRPRSY